MKARIHVMLKKGVLDPQGKAIAHALESMGFDGVGDVRQGKVIDIDLPDGTDEGKIRTMCDKLLANPVMEDYSVEICRA
jgi:phosphoribosylformylglycinamidine synthase